MSLDKPVQTLEEALAPGRREHIVLVGAGGKTTLLLALAAELSSRGRRVVASTTTKVWHKQARQFPGVVISSETPDWEAALDQALWAKGSIFFGKKVLDSGKVDGILPEVADKIYGRKSTDFLIIEGDGAAGHPVKAPGDHEPVIPSAATMVIAMLGLEGMWKGASEAVVFRLDRFLEITGARPGEILDPELLARVFLHPRGLFKGTPAGSRRVVFLNKADLMEKPRGGLDLAGTVLAGAKGSIDRVVIGSLTDKRYRIMEAENERDLQETY